MHLVIFGLTVSSSWGNGHATLWRSLIKALLRRGHTVSFYERDLPFYSSARDLWELPRGATLVLYEDLNSVRDQVKRDLNDADLALCTSFCPDGPAASDLILESRAGIKAFYDLDTPVTLDALRAERPVGYLPPRGLADFDLVLSFTGGRALIELKTRLGAQIVAPLYGSVDLENHRPVMPRDDMRATLSYLGTYAADRQEKLVKLFLEPARRLPDASFLIGGAQYPETLALTGNVRMLRHVPPADHPSFFSSSRATLNVTRGVMAEYGFCPQGRLFEAAACGTPLLSDDWEGLETFFRVGTELLVVGSADDVVKALSLGQAEMNHVAEAARARVQKDHTGDCRIAELERLCDAVSVSTSVVA